MSNLIRPHIVVGFDGSSGAHLALHYAVEEAAARNADVEVVLAYEWPPPSGWSPQLYTVQVLEPPAELKEELDAAVAFARERLGPDRARGILETSHPASLILSAATHARLVVIGSRDRTTVGAAILGSVTSTVAAKAPCPVVVTRLGDGQGPAPNRVVVGVDGSEISSAAVDFAFEEAERRHAALSVVHCWQRPKHSEPAPRDGHSIKQFVEEHRLALEESIAGARADHPDIHLSTWVIEGRAHVILNQLSEDARLLVVGSRGHGGVSGLLLGSVSQALLHHAHCSLAIVRPPRG
jgi:nucleotide-binding universal stress UspA family protein